ncbi:MAG TPA: hypothetical protein VG713_12295 [Pirellulales bacterium]|nr:hypothetical protein [Pirellulales bacterium]
MSANAADRAESSAALKSQSLYSAVHDLVETLSAQAKELERIVGHFEQQTEPLLPPSRLSTIVSQLSELQVRLRGMIGVDDSARRGEEIADLRKERFPLRDMDPLC